MSTFDRAAHCRRIAARGGRATVERHGTAYMQDIAKRGFAAAIALGWGPQLAAKLAPSYTAKFGRPIVLSAQSQEAARIRAEARRLYGGMTCDVAGCEARGQVHHMSGLHVELPNHPASIRILCDVHHRAEHRARRRAHLRHPQEIPA